MRRQSHYWEKSRTAVILCLLIALMACLEPRFLSPSNISNVLLQVSIEGIVATGLTLVVLTGGLDLSVGAVTALSGVIFVLSAPLGLAWAGLIALLSGTLVGMVNGFLIGPCKLNSFIVTLGAMAGVQGIALWISRGYPLAGTGGDFEMLGGGFFLHIPLPIVFYSCILIPSHLLVVPYTIWKGPLCDWGKSKSGKTG